MKLIGNRVRPIDARRVKPPAKQADDELLTPEHRRWRAIVLMRAGYCCQAMNVDGTRCTITHPLYADHIKERRDGGGPLDPENGQALCPRHHTAKTMRERAKRAGIGAQGVGV